MASVVTDKVFEKKYTKLKVFIRLGIRYAIYLAVLFFLLYVYMMNKHVDSPLKYTVYWWLVLLAACIVGIIAKMAREKDVSITVMRKMVDITVGSANDVYPVQNYVGPNFNTKRKKHDRHELIFDNPEDPDSNLIITLPGVPVRQFKDISDAIMISKMELAGENKYEAFEGGLYERNRKSSVDAKTVAYVLLAFAGTALIVGCELAFLINGMQDIAGFVVGMFFLFLFYIFLIVNLIRYLLEGEPRAQALKTMKFETSGFEINGQHYSYKEIETVTMTPPYLTDMSRFHRVLTVKLYDAKKPVRYSLGNRIEKEQTEKELAKDCTCTYPALYERIRTDKSLTRKFKL